MRKAFTLVELMVAVTIVMIVSGGGFIYISRFGARQKMEGSQKVIANNLRLARNFALTNQTKGGDDLRYVEVEIESDGTMRALANGDGALAYFEEDVTEDEISLTKSPSGSVFFSAYEGKLLKAEGGLLVPVAIGETVRVVINSSVAVGESRAVEILPSGLINEK